MRALDLRLQVLGLLCCTKERFWVSTKLCFVLHRFVVVVVRLFAGLAILPFAGLSLCLANCAMLCFQFALTALISDDLRLMSIKSLGPSRQARSIYIYAYIYIERERERDPPNIASCFGLGPMLPLNACCSVTLHCEGHRGTILLS